MHVYIHSGTLKISTAQCVLCIYLYICAILRTPFFSFFYFLFHRAIYIRVILKMFLSFSTTRQVFDIVTNR